MFENLNLDCDMDSDELLSWSKTAKALADYAANKSAAMQCRAKGDITTAQMYESTCEHIYSQLPDSVRW